MSSSPVSAERRSGRRHPTPVRIALIAVVAASIGAASSPLLAQTSPAPLPESDTQIPGLKTPTTALAWSLLGTAIPLGIGIAAESGQSDKSDKSVVPALVILESFLIGPSMGHFYAGRSRRAWEGIGCRAVAVGGLALALVPSDNDSLGLESVVLGVTCVFLGVASVIFDIVKAPNSARIHNEEILAGRRVKVGLAPIGHSHVPGLRLDVSL